MSNILSGIKLRFEILSYKRNFYINKILRYAIPTPLLHYLPHGFTVRNIAETKLRVVDNFCTREEVLYLVSRIREQLVDRDNKPFAPTTSIATQKTFLLSNRQDDKNLLPIIARGAMLAGVSTEHAEQLRIYHFTGSAPDLSDQEVDITLSSNSLCTILLFLSDPDSEQPGAIRFDKLNIAIRPQTGRAVFCPNWNKGNTTGIYTPRVILPVIGNNTVGNWVIQLSFQPYPIHLHRATLEPLQTRSGAPLEGGESMPAGTWIPSKAELG